MQRKKEAEMERKEQIEKQKAARAAKAAAELEKGRLSPKDLFRLGEEYKGNYSSFDDETGIPNKDADGEPLTKSANKGLNKIRAKQEKLHAKFLAAQKATNSINGSDEK